VTPAVKPIAKGQTKGEVGITLAPPAAVGKTPITFRATTKIGGKDYAVIPPPVATTSRRKSACCRRVKGKTRASIDRRPRSTGLESNRRKTRHS
jgi:hypothetical protein